ncbi:MAG: hypothetical protein HY726_08920 [Candidatus Rokubacteria bacterium]|nr:hypothetical protein [Candidatus Rokubacteria bacterium]
MKALAFTEHGGLDKLRYEDVPDPKIGPGEAGQVSVKLLDQLAGFGASRIVHLDRYPLHTRLGSVTVGRRGAKQPC